MNNKISEFREERSRLNNRILAPENDASIMKRVYALDTFAYNQRPTGLGAKEKEMLGLISSMVLRCDDCIKYHLEKCFQLGVANDEMMDIFGIANLVGGTIVIPHTRRAIEYWEILLSEQPSPSPFDPETKEKTYSEIVQILDSMLDGITNITSKMATIIEVLKNSIPYYYWAGFYLMDNHELVVGPYQGTHGCLKIKMGEGVCGRSAISKSTIIVDNIEVLNNEQESKKGNLHITCDPRCKSEIVIPVFNPDSSLLAVFDVDSLHLNAFCEVDKKNLEFIMHKYFSS